MQAIELFEERCVNYQAKGPISDEITALNVYLNSHHIVYSKVDYMMPEKPPTSEMLALAISDVCRGDSEYLYVFEQIEQRFVDLVGDYGAPTHVVYYYVSNVVISLLVLNRENSQLSSEILFKIIQRFNFRDPVLRAGIEVISEQVLRVCFESHQSPDFRYML